MTVSELIEAARRRLQMKCIARMDGVAMSARQWIDVLDTFHSKGE